LLYYGTVPPDFDVAAQATAAIGAVGMGGLAFTASYATYVANLGSKGIWHAATKARTGMNAFSATTRAVQAMIRAGSMTDDIAKGGRALVSGVRAAVTGFSAAAAGASVILIVGGILADIAIDQFVEIVTAEQKLQGKLDAAKVPIVLEEFLDQEDGMGQLAYLWSGMLENATGVADQRLAGSATTAWAAAKATDYRRPTPAPAPAPAPTPTTFSIPGMSSPEPARVLSVDPVAGTVRARLIDLAKVLVVRTTDAALLQATTPGKTIWVDLASRRASLDGVTACCSFTFATTVAPSP
jgi:Tfp pilus assembly protein PilE